MELKLRETAQVPGTAGDDCVAAGPGFAAPPGTLPGRPDGQIFVPREDGPAATWLRDQEAELWVPGEARSR